MITSLVGCGTMAPQPATETVDQAITGEWLVEPFNELQLGALDGQGGWTAVNDSDASPSVEEIPPDNGYVHDKVAALRTRRSMGLPLISSAKHAMIDDSSDKSQNFAFQVFIDADTPATSDIKSELALLDAGGASIVKFRFNGLNISLCGSGDTASNCQSFFAPAGTPGPRFQHRWYRVYVNLDQTAGTAYGQVNVVANATILAQTSTVTISTAQIETVAMTDFAREAGAVMLDFLLGYPKQPQ